MTVPPSFLVVSNVRYRFSESDGGRLIQLTNIPSVSIPAVPKARIGKGLNSILERTRRTAEARSLISRYFAF